MTQKPQYMTIFATPDNSGKFTLTDEKGNEAQEGFQYFSREEALSAAEKIWGSNTTWEGKKVKNGWRIKTN